jgi:2'-5' RNA ligase
MSKSKRNTVDPDDIIATYGADVARWFMLSDSPPDRDVIWSDERVQGASRFVQRLWRLVNESPKSPKRAGGAAGGVRRRRAGASQGGPWRAGQGLDRHREAAFQRLPGLYPGIRQCAGRRGRAKGNPAPDLAGRSRRPRSSLFNCFAPMMPHLAEECWQVLGVAVRFEGLGWFGGDKPRAILARIEANEALNDLQADHERRLRRIGLAPDPRNFTPHVTLARLRSVGAAAVADYLTTRGALAVPPFEAARFVLYSARDSVGGGPYVVEAVYPLQ